MKIASERIANAIHMAHEHRQNAIQYLNNNNLVWFAVTSKGISFKQFETPQQR